MLGLEGVRTQKTIMALATSGDMREIVEKAQSSYGGGQTGEAAETAMGGVNDQMTMLNETMAQTTATAGKPFLGFLEKVLGRQRHQQGHRQHRGVRLHPVIRQDRRGRRRCIRCSQVAQ